jgi:hypothetical protein
MKNIRGASDEHVQTIEVYRWDGIFCCKGLTDQYGKLYESVFAKLTDVCKLKGVKMVVKCADVYLTTGPQAFRHADDNQWKCQCNFQAAGASRKGSAEVPLHCLNFLVRS